MTDHADRDRPAADRPAADGDTPILDDPALAEALARVAAVGRLSDADVRAMRRSRRGAIMAGGAAALAMLVGVGAWQGGMFGTAPRHYATARGERLDLRLADGTRLKLEGATSVNIVIDRGQRLVELERGEAYFDVAHEPDRTFVVHAGASATRVLGTAFDIDMAHDEVKLAVYRGKVRFGDHGLVEGSVVVPAGWRSRFDRSGAQKPVRFDASQLDWRQNWLDTEAMRLADLVDTLNRRGGPLILPPPASLAHIPLSGRFKLDDPAQLLGAIGEAYGFSVMRAGDQIRLEPVAGDDAKPS
jgi:transmembrane sensor